jgi:hypothetical protein
MLLTIRTFNSSQYLIHNKQMLNKENKDGTTSPVELTTGFDYSAHQQDHMTLPTITTMNK